MKRLITLGLLALTFALVTEVLAQPGGGGRRRGGGGVNASQILGMLAFDAESNITDDQLVKLRAALKPVHQKQTDLLRSVRSGERDFQDVREDMLSLRGELIEAVSAVLRAAQVERLKTQMQRQAQRGGGQRGQRGQRGGGGGGR
ncbi:TPA: hypothetical protein DCE37_13640 [Candidatus Latescibacteria bacterium]|nr:hypothetical protein [Candidatus Latescibacterota bacterium]|tara:strand:+ start:214 stop:648 length:435 start_codon:yes stop_codon:yes gene_type:complete